MIGPSPISAPRPCGHVRMHTLVAAAKLGHSHQALRSWILHATLPVPPVHVHGNSPRETVHHRTHTHSTRNPPASGPTCDTAASTGQTWLRGPLRNTFPRARAGLGLQSGSPTGTARQSSDRVAGLYGADIKRRTPAYKPVSKQDRADGLQ